LFPTAKRELAGLTLT
jgi:hypothetical protein